MSRESRYFDVFTDICESLGYADKSTCYLITNEYEVQLKEWFNERNDEEFLESFCYKELPDCNKEVNEASLTDIELENYEEDKDKIKIDEDFMPEAKEETVKEEEGNFGAEAFEKVQDIKDNVLDFWDKIDEKTRKFLTENILENKKIRPFLETHIKGEHVKFFFKNFHVGLVCAALFSLLVPCVFLLLQQKRSDKSSAKFGSAGSRSKKNSKSASKVATVPTIETSESDAAEADDETSGTLRKTSGRSSRILATNSPSKRATSKRNSKSQAD